MEDEVFSYRAQRWLWREAEQLRRRYVKFNLQALQRACETAVGTDMRCTEITRLPEGNFNKTFMMTMRSGAQIIARVANPNAGHPHYTIASEVATMDYVLCLSMYGSTERADSPNRSEHDLTYQYQRSWDMRPTRAQMTWEPSTLLWKNALVLSSVMSGRTSQADKKHKSCSSLPITK